MTDNKPRLAPIERDWCRKLTLSEPRSPVKRERPASLRSSELRGSSTEACLNPWRHPLRLAERIAPALADPVRRRERDAEAHDGTFPTLSLAARISVFGSHGVVAKRSERSRSGFISGYYFDTKR